MSVTTNTEELIDAVMAQLDAMIAAVDGQELVSQNRCVDQLLDLLNLAAGAALRDEIVRVLDDIRSLSSLRADEMAVRYRLLGAVADLESTTS